MSQLRFGHTAITWVPYFEPDEAVRDIAALGFPAMETFGKVLEDYERDRGGFGPVLAEHGIRLNAAYLFSTLLDPATAADDIELNVGWARMAKDLGADAVVIGAGSRDQDRYTANEFRVLARTLGEIGRRCLDLGLPACFHPHTGTPVETREEIDRLMELIDPEVVFFAPDTGQIAKGGGDPVEVLRTYLGQVRHVHLKDYIGGEVEHDGDGNELDRSGWLDYTPLGDGVVDIPTILRILEGAGFDGWVNIELDGNEQHPLPAKPAAARSKQYLEQLLGEPIGTDKEHQHAARVD